MRTRLVPAYDAAHEVTLQGTIEKVIAKAAAGSPLGLHVIVATAGGDVDAHLGLFNMKRTKEVGVVPGATVEAVGAIVQVRGKNLLLVRMLTVGGQTIVIRNESGVPAFQMAPRTSSGKIISRGNQR